MKNSLSQDIIESTLKNYLKKEAYMMRNWFILFATTFTITTLVITMTTWFLPSVSAFDTSYIVLLAISNALISLFMIVMNRIAVENIVLSIIIDIIFIFFVVYGTGIVIHLIPIDFFNFVYVLSSVIVIYIIITLIYMFILKKEAEDMNEKISHWRKKHAESEPFK